MPRCSVNTTSFWCGDEGGDGIAPAPSGSCASRTRSATAGLVKITPSRVASSRYFVSAARCRTSRASGSRRVQGCQLGLEFLHRAGGGRLVEDLSLSRFHFVVRRVVEVLDVIRGEDRSSDGQ